MKISVYMVDFACKYGGAEAYTAALIESLQKTFVDSEIELITEFYKGNEKLSPVKLAEMQNMEYGTDIRSSNFNVSYLNFKKIDENSEKNKLVRIFKVIEKELLAIKRFNFINKKTKKSDLFINASFKILGGRAKKNLCIVHFPYLPCVNSGINKRLFYFKKQAQKRDQAYKSYDLYLPNSDFTSTYLKKYWQIPINRIKTLYPPVNLVSQIQTKIKGQILICSRIDRSKKIDLLIKAFLSSKYLSENASLLVAGSALGEDQNFVNQLKKSGDKVRFVFDPSRSELEKIYAESQIFWHAKGLDSEDPFESEHFGITTVEAMSAGCVPLVINKGGQTEIVSDDCGFRWNTIEELVNKTEELLKDDKKIQILKENCIKRSQVFSFSHFSRLFYSVVSEAVNA